MGQSYTSLASCLQRQVGSLGLFAGLGRCFDGPVDVSEGQGEFQNRVPVPGTGHVGPPWVSDDAGPERASSYDARGQRRWRRVGHVGARAHLLAKGAVVVKGASYGLAAGERCLSETNPCRYFSRPSPSPLVLHSFLSSPRPTSRVLFLAIRTMSVSVHCWCH